jgi:hypothetical protein
LAPGAMTPPWALGSFGAGFCDRSGKVRRGPSTTADRTRTRESMASPLLVDPDVVNEIGSSA